MAAQNRRIVSSPTPDDDAAAAEAGLNRVRNVFQLRCRLPLDRRASITTRAFRPGSSDEAAWIDANNRAFATHPDQSGMTASRLHAEMKATWFDPDGFRLHEDQGRLAGFCWTKRHPAHGDDPAMGEIYVIGVDPDFQGRGLGRELVLAGLDWLVAAGEAVGMLYVDETNTPAVTLYEQLGFVAHHTDRIYEAASDTELNAELDPEPHPDGQPTQ